MPGLVVVRVDDDPRGLSRRLVSLILRRVSSEWRLPSMGASPRAARARVACPIFALASGPSLPPCIGWRSPRAYRSKAACRSFARVASLTSAR
jgi:hypothetical protein